jgi:hypothetical protein
MAAKINAEEDRKRALEAARDGDRAEAYAWSLRMEGFGRPLWRVKGASRDDHVLRSGTD